MDLPCKQLNNIAIGEALVIKDANHLNYSVVIEESLYMIKPKLQYSGINDSIIKSFNLHNNDDSLLNVDKGKRCCNCLLF
jgi:hypothetical protein